MHRASNGGAWLTHTLLQLFPEHIPQHKYTNNYTMHCIQGRNFRIRKLHSTQVPPQRLCTSPPSNLCARTHLAAERGLLLCQAVASSLRLCMHTESQGGMAYFKSYSTYSLSTTSIASAQHALHEARSQESASIISHIQPHTTDLSIKDTRMIIIGNITQLANC